MTEWLNVFTFHHRDVISASEKQQPDLNHDRSQVHSALHRNLVSVQKWAVTASGNTTIYGKKQAELRQTERNVPRPKNVTWFEEIVGKRAKEATIMRSC